MKKITVRSCSGNYPVFVGKKLLAGIGQQFKTFRPQGCKVLIVTQKKIACLYLSALRESLRKKGFKVFVHFIPDGEPAKSEKELFRIFHSLLGFDFERRDMILGLGGGVVGDLSGFAASTYLRGIDFVNAGTTLLAQVDSSIGGKTGINLPEGKNLVGAFYPPLAVISDVSVLKTLPAREFAASLAEVVKCGMIRDKNLFSYLERNTKKILARDSDALEKIVQISAEIKAQVVSRDEFETKGERMILNFGHTFGHAIEKILNYRGVLHGEAVAIGMVCAARLAIRLKIFSNAEAEKLQKLLRQFRLPVAISDLKKRVRVGDFLSAMRRDKKKKSGKLRFVLPVRIGKVVIRKNIPENLIRKIIRESVVRLSA